MDCRIYHKVFFFGCVCFWVLCFIFLFFFPTLLSFCLQVFKRLVLSVRHLNYFNFLACDLRLKLHLVFFFYKEVSHFIYFDFDFCFCQVH